LRRAMVGAILTVAIGFWAFLAVGVSLKTALRGHAHSVYPVFAAASQHWWADKPLYADYEKSEGIDGYRYSPTFAVAFTPFCLLPDRVGAILWALVSIGLLVWALHVLARDVLPGDWPAWREGAFLTLSLLGSAVGIWSGQSNAILPALIAFGLAAIVRGRWWTASWLLAVPVFIKLWPMAVVLLLMVCWPRKLIWRFAVVCVVLALVPFLTRPPSIVAWQYHEWYVSLTGPLQGRWTGYRDAWTIWEQLCPPVHRHAYMALQLVTAVGVLGWCVWQRQRVQSTGHLLTLIFSMWVSWQLLFGPGTEQLTYGIIAPSASWAVLVSLAEKKARWLTWTAYAALTYLPAHDVEKAVLGAFPAGMILLPIGVVLFVVWLVWHERGKVELLSIK
jgi:alpha-1,2-mannosyltransferase